MTIEIVVPQVGEAVSEVTLVEWHKQEGEAIKKGDILFEVDTDKAIVEVEAFADGILAQILVSANSPVMPQQVVGLIAPAGESRRDAYAEISPRQPRHALHRSPMAQRVAAELGVDLGGGSGSGPGGRITAKDIRQSATQQTRETPLAGESGGQVGGSFGPPVPPSGEAGGANRSERVPASPKARRLAKELGMTLTGLTGTGVDGLITAEDVRAAAISSPQPGPQERGELDHQPLSKLRQTIARRMQASKQTAPHFYLMVDVDMTQAQRLRAYCRETLGWERRPTYTDIIVRACALALAAMPEVNVFYADTGIARRHTIDIGIAVSVEGGLIVPVLPQADRLSLGQTATQIRGLSERARQGRLRQADLAQTGTAAALQGKSMVVSNLGMYGVDIFVAIIDIPDPMILAVGRVADRIVPVDGQPAIRPICTLTLSADHRAFDGVQGAQFLRRVKDSLENPFEILAGTAAAS